MKKIKMIMALLFSEVILLGLPAAAQSGGTALKNLDNYSTQNNLMEKHQSKTIVFITGAFVNHACWDEWRVYFESKGFTTIAPPWPGKNGTTAELRARHPDRVLAAVTLSDVISSYAHIIDSLPEKPILIGHSFGGAISQILLNRGYGVAAVAIHSAPPQGVFPYEINFLRSGFGALGLFTSLNKTYMMSFKKFQFAFVNGMPLSEQRKAYDALAIPESKRAARGGLSSAAYVDFKKPHPPLLLLAGEKDQIIPAHLCKRVYKKYSDKNSITEYVEKDRNHFILGLPTWKEDAEYVLNWIYNTVTPKKDLSRSGTQD